MAIEVMTWVWSHSQSRHGARLVLLAVADYMNSGHSWAWPSMAELADKTRLKERAIQVAIADLAKLGELEVERGGGPKGCNRYRVLMTTTPAENAPPQKMHPAEDAPPQESRGAESEQVNVQDPAENAPLADSAGVQISTSDPAENAPGTVKEPKPKNPPTGDSSARTHARRIPDDFEVTPDMAEWARKNVPVLIAAGRGMAETDRFIDHWHSAGGANARKRDWVAAWRNWMREAEDRLVARQGNAQNGSSVRRGGQADDLSTQKYGPGSTDI